MRREALIEFMERDAYRPLTVQELCEAFDVVSGDDFRRFVQLLADMEERGDVVRTRANRYGRPDRMNLVVGRLQMKARGYGFVLPEAAGEPDVYVASGDMDGAMPGDKVMVRVERVASGARREGKIIRILERAVNRVVGKFTRYKDYAFVTPLDKRYTQDIFVPQDQMMDAHDGYVVVAEITAFPTPNRGPEGRIVEVLGHPDAPGIDILSVVRKYGLPETFPEDVLAEAEAISLELSEADYKGRRDLRHETIVTIDGEDAKDLDDAVHVKELANGNFELGVHIADVGYYVRQGSKLDREAFNRGTSVYLVDRVIPMLPQRLSNIICSLNPQIDRLTLSCVMEISPRGQVVNHDIFPSVIRTTERMTYTNVRKILVDKDPEVRARYERLIPDFERMERLMEILRRRRMERGAIDFDFDEVKVVVDDLGHPTEIVQRVRSVAERMIEEFMLAANETVAEHFHWLGVPFVYRIHEEPDAGKMMDFNEFIHNFGYHVKGAGGSVHPRALQDVLRRIEGTREETVISRLMLRSMRQARYAPECVGHFGLAAKYYTHFTSPIRRYPDLVIHRIIREALKGPLPEAREATLTEFVADAAARSSERERIAQEAEREVDQMKMVEYMLDHIGETYEGIISGVTQFGLFIQLDNGAEGLIHISYLTDDYYVLNQKQMALVGERTRRVFRLGDPVAVQVSAASKEDLTIDFQLVEHRREGTMVRQNGVESVVYDEDLSPKARRKQVNQRRFLAEQRAAERNQRKGRGAAPARRASPTSERGAGDGTRGSARSHRGTGPRAGRKAAAPPRGKRGGRRAAGVR
ncbi:MAG: ribonuclease R [Alicyclobacillus sp.]|nr:ribonuclease R [Alicyclobacillus sp.]